MNEYRDKFFHYKKGYVRYKVSERSRWKTYKLKYDSGIKQDQYHIVHYLETLNNGSAFSLNILSFTEATASSLRLLNNLFFKIFKVYIA